MSQEQQEQYRSDCQETFHLRAEGYPLKEIALQLGVTMDTVQRRLAWWRENGTVEGEEVIPYRRKLSLERLDYLSAVLRAKVAQGDEKAIQLLLQVMDRESKLLGLDAPAKTEVSGKTVNYMVDGVNPDLV
jgi:transposase